MKSISKQGSIITTAIALLILSSCGDESKNKIQPSSAGNKPAALKVDALVLQPKTLLDNVEASGSLMPFENTELHPEVAGRITGIFFKEGSSVSQGTLLVKLYDADLKAQLNKQQVQLATAEKTVERYGQLLKISGISQQEYDLAVLQVNNIKADIQLLQTNIAKTELRAPFNGKLGLKNISMGAYITPSTVITTIAEVKQLKLQFSVPEKYASQVKNGQQVNFNIDGVRKSFSANVIATEVTIAEETRNLSVRAVVKANDPALVPGAFAKVKIELGKTTDALMVPADALMPQGRKKTVFVYRAGFAEPVEVTTGVRDSANVQVLTGLSAGDTVITSGLLYLKPKSEVKLTKIN